MKSIVPQKKIGWQFYMTWKKMSLNPELYLKYPEVRASASLSLEVVLEGRILWSWMEDGVVTASIPESPWLDPFEAKSFSLPFLLVLFFFLQKWLFLFRYQVIFLFDKWKWIFFVKFFHCNWIHERSTLKLV